MRGATAACEANGPVGSCRRYSNSSCNKFGSMGIVDGYRVWGLGRMERNIGTILAAFASPARSDFIISVLTLGHTIYIMRRPENGLHSLHVMTCQV